MHIVFEIFSLFITKGGCVVKNYNENPMRFLLDFLHQEEEFNKDENRDDIRFIGYALDVRFNNVEVITSDPFKKAVGGIPRNSFLIMTLDNFEDVPLHFTVLKVLDIADTPVQEEQKQIFFEMQKKSMPKLDIITQSELQWSALNTEVLGMFYQNPENEFEIEFSADVNNFVSPYKYRIYAPTEEFLDIIINSTLPKEERVEIGNLRITENRLHFHNKKQNNIPVYTSVLDFLATRTALFGKTRLGKSNIVKLIAQSLIESNQNIGQLIFDINGEYANDNPQDGNTSLRSMYPDDAIVYSLSPKENTQSKLLKLNFYLLPEESHPIIGELLSMNGRDGSIYVESFANVKMPSFREYQNEKLSELERKKILWKIFIYWAILNKAGFELEFDRWDRFDPEFNENLRVQAYGERMPIAKFKNISDLTYEVEKISNFMKKINDVDEIVDSNGIPIFDRDHLALFHFLNPPKAGSGVAMIQPFRRYHDENPNFFIKEIIKSLEQGKTIILDLGNAEQDIMQYYSNRLSKEIFEHQVRKFTNNQLGDHYIQLYFEEAHNLFPANENKDVSIYRRIAKEGAKYHIGMVYSTQSVTTINNDLLNQTENFFVVHLSSEQEVNALANVNSAFKEVKEDLLSVKTPGFARMLTRSHRFVVPVQAKQFKKKECD